MKTHFLFILFSLCCVGTSLAGETEAIQDFECYILSVEDDQRIPKNRAVVRVTVPNSGLRRGELIQYGYDNLSFEVRLDRKRSFEFALDSGNVAFLFHAKKRKKMAEILSSELNMKGGAITTLVINFRKFPRTSPPQVIKKPVIYFYPTQNETISVELKPKGELTFTYPIYEQGWTFEATPSGELLVGDERFNYLFWEAEMEIDERGWMDEGKIVARDELMTYLESWLDKFHFNSKEKADFITFWAPQMQRHDQTFVRFIFNEACNQFADLKISPTPDQLIRLYIVWTPIDPDIEPRKFELQQFPEMPNRTGFNVLEWGGCEVTKGVFENTAEVN